jgi:integrase/recombinase XerD
MRTPDANNLGRWIRRFLIEHLVIERNLTRNTQQSYRDTFRLLIPFAATQQHRDVDGLSISDVSADVVRAFLQHLEGSRRCGVRTRNQRLAAVHAFATFVAERCPELILWCGEIRTVPFKRYDRPALCYLEKAEMDALLAAPNQQTEQGRREHGLLLFLYNTGARASEAASVSIGDVDWQAGGAGSVRLSGKGGKTRYCPLWPKTIQLLRVLTEGRALSEAVFLNRRRRPLTRFAVRAIVTRCVTRAAANQPSLLKKSVSPHVIRHTTATHLLRSGVDINTIRAWLGHVSIDTTNIYAEVDLETKAKMLNACQAFAPPSRPPKRWRDDASLMQFLQHL